MSKRRSSITGNVAGAVCCRYRNSPHISWCRDFRLGAGRIYCVVCRYITVGLSTANVFWAILDQSSGSRTLNIFLGTNRRDSDREGTDLRLTTTCKRRQDDGWKSMTDGLWAEDRRRQLAVWWMSHCPWKLGEQFGHRAIYDVPIIQL